ncbi:MAG: hypothetical protein OZSIB_2960 [Candidatus Ozemobacter sibiricus]|uniref:DUF3298 domain-containing protein n=1 Tax=Candidatus Ozemobacter sibiricus TaxID=2268124 RepID=A0A367ZS15_9BACT|nr:MAG: hypothetical protein OZSIB_2960 [Candidatus Ozemobacter sibiricus]
MRKNLLWTLTLVTVVTLLTPALIVAAGAGVPAGPIPVTKTISAVMQHVQRTAPPPADRKEALSAEIDLTYPEFTSSKGPDPVVDKLNQLIRDRLFGMIEGEKPTSVDQLVETFFRDYAKALKEDPDQPGAWSLKFEATIRHADDDLLSLEMLQSAFTGGAHPTSMSDLLVLSPKTGARIDLPAVVPPDRMGELVKVGERHFRKVRELKDGETYEEAGFLFEGNKFALNDNFLIASSGLVFWFNPYEIAPYAMGPTELVLPWNELKGIVDPKGPAGKFLAQGK